MQNLVCNDNFTRSTHVITRCCNTADYCNLKEGFLPSLAQAKRQLLDIKSANGSNLINGLPLSSSSSANNYRNNPHHQQSGEQSLTDLLIDQYSNIPLELILVFIILSGLLLIIVIALAQHLTHRRRRRTRRESSRASSAAGGGSGHHGDEDYSENSSGKVNSDVAVYDTNSMASREPLISNGISTGVGQNTYHTAYPANSLTHPNPNKVPWMADESYTGGRALPSFQMSMGSGDPQNKQETSSGSGSGQPYLTQRSIAHDIELKEIVGRGYYGVVWRGVYKGEPVAVKIFHSMAEPSWEREAEIYQTTLLRHKNILGYIATDKRDDVTMTGYWLVTDYYPMGSLFDFLVTNSLTIPDAVRMAFSIANGLSHLHVEIFGTQGKPAIAHRDLKSKNILVKNDGTCCIADLGMAVRYDSNNGIVDVPANTRVGTRRYLAPELLDDKLNLMDFEAVKATDVYALGLVLWEILRRTCYTNQRQENVNTADSNNTQETTTATTSNPESSITSPTNEMVLCDPYEAPYQEYVKNDPSTEDMRKIVCERKVRPTIADRWAKYPPMRDYTTLMRECWYEKPAARLSALRIRKSLGEIAKHYFNLNMEYD